MAKQNGPQELADSLENLRIMKEEMRLLAEIQNQSWDKINGSISSVLLKYKDIRKAEDALNKARKEAQKYQDAYNDAKKLEKKFGGQLTDKQRAQLKDAKNLNKEAQKKLEYDTKAVAMLKDQVSLAKGLGGSLMNAAKWAGEKSWGFLMTLPGYINDADKAIRELNLSLGNSGNSAANMRDKMIEAGQYGAKFGMSVRDIAQMQAKYAQSTGRAAGMLTSELKSVTAIAKGTSLGADGAAEMAGNFAKMGLDANVLKTFLEDTTNEAASFGVNAGNVLQDLNTNFARSQNFTFARGKSGLKDMAMNAQKLKISMEATFNAADKARTLQGSLDMASQLMVLGGQFAQADPFKLSFMARNDPAKFQEVISNMTEGVATFNKATGQIGVNANDMDRLRQVAEATSIPLDQLKNSAVEFTKIKMAKKSLFAGTDEDRDMIARMATMREDGSFRIEIGGNEVDLEKLTASQITMVKAQKSSLEARARDSQAFDEVYKNFIMELKATFLPFLKALTPMLEYLKKIIDGLNPTVIKMMAYGGAVVGVTAKLASVVGPFVGGVKGLLSMRGGGGASLAQTAASSVGGGASAAGSAASAAGGGGGRLSGMLGSGGSSMAATLAAVGVAAVGVGYGLKLATEGIATLATAMKGMTGGEITGMVIVVGVLAAGFVAMALGLATFANPMSLAGLAVVAGLSVTMIAMGYAIKLATDGVANMFAGMKSLASVDMSPVKDFFKSTTDFLTADGSNFAGLMATVSFLQSSQMNILSEMREIMSTPVKMVMSGDNKMVVNVDLTTMIDSQKLTSSFSKAFNVDLQRAAQGTRSLR